MEFEKSESNLQIIRLLTVMEKSHQALFRIHELERLFERICQIAVEEGGFRMAWVGMLDPQTGWVKPNGWWGHVDGYLDNIKISILDIPEGQGPTGKAVRSGKYQICQDIEKDSGMLAWRENALKRGFRASGAFPLMYAGQAIGTLNLYAENSQAFDLETTQMMWALSDSLAFAISNIKQEMALRENEAKYRSLFENSLQGILYHDQNGKVISANPAAERILGLTLEQLQGRSAVDPRWHAIHEDGTDFPEDSYPARQALVSGKPVLGVVMGVFDPKIDAYRWLMMDAVPQIYSDETNPYHAVSTFSDITERRESQQLLRLQSTALESVPNGIMITDPDATIRWVNPAFTKLTGYEAIEVVGLTPRILQSGWHDKSFYRNLWATVLSGEIWRGELINRRKDGSFYTEETVITPLRNAHGEIVYFIAIKQDITDRKHRQREMESIATLSAAMRTAPTRAEMLPVILEQIIHLLEAPGAELITFNDHTMVAQVELAKGVLAHSTGKKIPAGEGISGYVIKTGRSYLTQDVANDPRIYNRQDMSEIKAVACVPLISQGQTIGALLIGRQKEILETEVKLLTAIADIAANALQRATLHEQTQLRLKRLEALRAIDQAISSSMDLRLTLGVLLDQIINKLLVDAADVLLFNTFTNMLEFSAERGFRTNIINQTRIRLGEGLAGKTALDRRPLIYPNLSNVPTLVYGHLMASESFKAYVAVPLVVKGQIKGVLEIYHRQPFDPDSDWVEFIEMLAGQAAIAIDNAALFEGVQRSNLELALAYDETIEGWSRALDLRDKETEGHTQRVTDLTLRLARMVGIGENELVHIRRGALLHDIGKMGVPDMILLKPGPLTDEEWLVMRKHPEYAYEMLAPIAYLRSALDIPYCHHEKWDGTGYPRRLRGEQIPLAARIFAVVDVFDALTSDRPYRPSWSLKRTLDHIWLLSGTHFDPQVVEQFLKLQKNA
jgi:PAS domain S-box-containing protein